MKRLGMIALCMVLGAGLLGCGANKKKETENKTRLTVAIDSETGGLDPAGNIALTYLAYSVTALDELLTYDENGEIEYRAAKSYEVDETATKWTFHLREEALWSDGSKVTSEDFKNTIVRALDPLSQSGYANYLFVIKNAEAIYNGTETMENLGVETPDELTLVFQLEHPCVYFLDLLRLPVYTPSNRTYATETGSGWDKDCAKSLSNGPFYLKEYVPEQYMLLEKNETYWNANEIKIDQILYRFFDDKQSMANAYEAGEVDVATALPSYVMDLYEGKDELLITDQIATRYIYMNLDVEPLDDVRVREALNLAIDRESLCKAIGKDTEPTYNFIAKYMKDKETGAYYSEESGPLFEENVEEAKRLLAEAGYPDGEGFPKLTYKFPTLEMDMDTAQVLVEQWKKNLNIDIALEPQELQVNYSDRKARDFDLCRMNWTADFADPYTYLSMLLSNSTYNCSGIKDPAYDQIVQESDSEIDPVKRTQLVLQAQEYAIKDQFYIIPLYSMKSCNLIRDDIRGIKQIPATGALDYRNVVRGQ